MPLYTYKDYKPKISPSSFIAPSADIIGRVLLNDSANIWFNCVIRGDVNEIIIGKNTNIQDLSMLHVTEKDSLHIGENVTIGHSVILHACKIGDGCLIGMGAKVLDGSIIGKNSLVAAGSIVPPGKIYPAGSFIIGSPAVVKRALSSEEIIQYSTHYKTYVGYASKFKNENYFSELK